MGIPKVGGEIPGAPSFHENDIYAFNAYISKFLCKYDIFTRRTFLESLINGFLEKSSAAYPIEGKKAALDNPHHELNYLISYCIKQLTQMRLVGRKIGDDSEAAYIKTSRLAALCSRINEYDMPFVEGLVTELTNIEKEIENQQYFHEILVLLRVLSKRHIERSATKLGNDTITKLIDLGVINKSVTGTLSLTNIGKILLV